jgi:DNA-directed RNA polymerase subunit RPC12/RpoP
MKKYPYKCSKCKTVMHYVETNLTQEVVDMACPNMCGYKQRKNK